MKRLILTIVFALLPSTAFAQLSLTTLGQATTIDFTGFTAAGISASPSAGQLDSNIWRITGFSDGDTTFGGGPYTTGDFARGSSTGNESIGGIYAFAAAGSNNPALGVQPGSTDFTPGDATLRVKNDTGSTVTSIDFSIRRCYLNNEDRSSTLSVTYSTDDTTYSQVGNIVPANTPAAQDSSPTWQCLVVSTTMTGLSLANGALLYFKFSSDDNGGTGSRDELAVDDISITPNGSTADGGADTGADSSADTTAADTSVDGSSGDTSVDGSSGDTSADTGGGDTAGGDSVSADTTVDSGTTTGDTSVDSLVSDSTVDSGSAGSDTTPKNDGGGSGDSGGCCDVGHGSTRDVASGLMVLALLLIPAVRRRRRRRR